MAEAGSLGFVGAINGNNTGDTTPSSFAFITISGIGAGETISFADSLTGATGSSEGSLTVTFNQPLLPGAVVIVQLGVGGQSASIFVTDNAGGTFPVSADVTINGALTFGSSDQIYAFNGTAFGAANVIAGVDFSGAAGVFAGVPSAAIKLDLRAGDVGNNEGFVLSHGVTPTAANLANRDNFDFNKPVTTSNLANVVCFMPGTLIATPSGHRPVESLSRGDLVFTHDGRAAPVRWLGRQTVSRMFSDPLRVLPIRIRAGALGEAMPERDLLVSTDHALMLDGVLVQAGALVNGSTIVRERNVPAVFTYYHVELADHALLLAEGVPAETFIDNVDRMRFDNWDEHDAIETAAPMAELELPRAKSARQVPTTIRKKIAARAHALVEKASVA